MDIDELFQKEDRKIVENTTLLERIENEYRTLSQPTAEKIDRDNEKKKIEKKIKNLQAELKTIRNVKNPKKSTINTSQSEKREQVRGKIGALQKRLRDIDMEDMSEKCQRGKRL